MKYSILKIPILVISLLLFLFFTDITYSIVSAYNSDLLINNSDVDSEMQINDIALMSNYYDKTKKFFDRNKAINDKFSIKSVNIADELFKFNDDILKGGESGLSNVNLDKYPNLKKFFQESKKVSEKGNFNLNLEKNSRILYKYGTTDKASAAFAPEFWSKIACGYFGNPKPTSAKQAYWFRNISNPSATLSSWGYHATPSIGFGGGFTRPQTVDWYSCGWNTFRDHAWVPAEDVHSIKEQNYNGWNPRGEPNPELYASGPWPYGEWPSYVYWWHSTY